jgi:hypothetical protein
MTPQLVAAILAAQRPSEIDLAELSKRESEGLLGSLVAQRGRLQLLSEMAFAEQELHAATNIERAITSSLELTSRLLGQLVTQHHVTHTNILVSTDYLKLRASILNALKPFPDAARAVGAALHALEAEAATDIATSKKPLMLEASPC